MFCCRRTQPKMEYVIPGNTQKNLNLFRDMTNNHEVIQSPVTKAMADTSERTNLGHLYQGTKYSVLKSAGLLSTISIPVGIYKSWDMITRMNEVFCYRFSSNSEIFYYPSIAIGKVANFMGIDFTVKKDVVTETLDIIAGWFGSSYSTAGSTSVNGPSMLVKGALCYKWPLVAKTVTVIQLGMESMVPLIGDCTTWPMRKIIHYGADLYNHTSTDTPLSCGSSLSTGVGVAVTVAMVASLIYAGYKASQKNQTHEMSGHLNNYSQELRQMSLSMSRGHSLMDSMEPQIYNRLIQTAREINTHRTQIVEEFNDLTRSAAGTHSYNGARAELNTLLNYCQTISILPLKVVPAGPDGTAASVYGRCRRITNAAARAAGNAAVCFDRNTRRCNSIIQTIGNWALGRGCKTKNK